MRIKFITLAAASAFALSAAAPVSAAELVTNGGFETGTFSGWSLSGSGSSGVYANFPGLPASLQNFRAAFNGASVTLFQDIATVTGQGYNFGFTNQVDAGTTSNSFSAAFGGATIYSQSNINSAGMGFTPRSFGVVATSALTRVSFTFASAGGFQNFDNVNVNAVPEPATWAMMLLGFGAMGASLRYRRRSVRVAFA